MRNDEFPYNKKKKRKKKAKITVGRTVLIAAVVIGIFVFSLAGTFFVMRSMGKRQLKKDSMGSVAGIRMNREEVFDKDGEETDNGSDVREQSLEIRQEEKEGRVFYNGKVYDFNRDILTFLVMGIDQKSEKVKEQKAGFDGGSADAIFLLVLNPHTKKMQVLAIDRNTMTDVDIYSYEGEYEETVTTQLAVQHGFGDGTVKSAGYMEKAVSNLMHGIPINGYCAVNMSAISRINDAVGGVEVTVLEDLTVRDKSLVKGNKVHLMGDTAFWYVKYRDINVFASSVGRLERQKQYIGAFITQAKRKFKEDPSLPMELFQTLQEYMTTDLNVNKVTYLASMAAGFDFSGTDIRKVEGKTVQGEEYEEFYVDEDALYELILDVFYEEVPVNG